RLPKDDEVRAGLGDHRGTEGSGVIRTLPRRRHDEFGAESLARPVESLAVDTEAGSPAAIPNDYEIAVRVVRNGRRLVSAGGVGVDPKLGTHPLRGGRTFGKKGGRDPAIY